MVATGSSIFIKLFLRIANGVLCKIVKYLKIKIVDIVETPNDVIIVKLITVS
jgi:hypothetical protein